MNTINGSRAAAIVLLVAVCAGPWGCARSHPRSYATYNVPAQAKTIGLSAARFLPDTKLQAPGKGRGAARGAGYGAAAGAVPGLAIAGVAEGCPTGSLICAALLVTGLSVAATGTAVGAIGGAVYGALTAEPVSALSAAESEIRGAVVTLRVQEALRDRVLQIARGRSRVKFLALHDAGRTVIDELIGYGALADEGIEAVVEISVPTIGLAGEGSIHPPLWFFMTASARVIRTADGAELYKEKFEYRGGSLYKFVEWGAEEAKAFRQAIDFGILWLAADIEWALFPPTADDDTTPPVLGAETEKPPAVLNAADCHISECDDSVNDIAGQP